MPSNFDILSWYVVGIYLPVTYVRNMKKLLTERPIVLPFRGRYEKYLTAYSLRPTTRM